MSGARWTRWRRAVQGATAAMYLLLPFLGEAWLAGTLAALRVGPVDLVEPAGALSAAAAARALPPALALGVLPVVALALALGPVYCSWLCPWGLLSEGLDRLRAHVAPLASAPGATDAGRRRRLRLALLAGLLALSALAGAPVASFLSPPRLATALPLEAVSARVVPWVTGGLLLLLLAVELAAPRRIVCRVLCPAGALAALLRRPFTWGPTFTDSLCRCPDHPPCARACPWGLDPRRLARRDGCTSCMACVDECPSGALTALQRGVAKAE